MEKQQFLIIISVIIVVTAIILRLISWTSSLTSPKNNKNNQAQTLVGSDRDIHGCIGSAGYIWCELKHKCLRSWEEPCAPKTIAATSTDLSPLAAATSSLATSSAATGDASPSVEVIVDNPRPNEIIKSPLSISGRAPGTWFFEATLPVRLIGEDNNIIVLSNAQAQSEWMTEKMVPFVSRLEFTVSSTSPATGYLIIAKDNPSGLPQNDGEFKVPVRFR